MKKKDTDLWLIKTKSSGKVKVTTRCIVVPPTPTTPTTLDVNTNIRNQLNLDTNNNTNNTNQNSPNESHQLNVCSNNTDCSPSPTQEYISSHYTRNRSTTRSWPVIYRNTNPAQESKQDQLQRYQEKRHYSTHQYDFDQMYGLNTSTYNNYLACSQNFDDDLKSPSFFDMQQHTTQSDNNPHHTNNPAQTNTPSICSAQPPIIFLFVTLLITSSATAMLCVAIGSDHWEHVTWDTFSLNKLVNQSMTSKYTGRLEFLLDGKVARLPVRSE